MRSPRSATFQPSLNRLRTVFSSSTSSTSTPTQSSTTSPSTSTTSRRMRGVSPSGSISSTSSTSSIRALLLSRHSPSMLDLELEAEREVFGSELGLLEPRPSVSGVGIFEVLDGRV